MVRTVLCRSLLGGAGSGPLHVVTVVVVVFFLDGEVVLRSENLLLQLSLYLGSCFLVGFLVSTRSCFRHVSVVVASVFLISMVFCCLRVCFLFLRLRFGLFFTLSKVLCPPLGNRFM